MITKEFSPNRLIVSLKQHEHQPIKGFMPFNYIHVYLQRWPNGKDAAFFTFEFKLKSGNTSESRMLYKSPNLISLSLFEIITNYDDFCSIILSCDEELEQVVIELNSESLPTENP